MATPRGNQHGHEDGGGMKMTIGTSEATEGRVERRCIDQRQGRRCGGGEALQRWGEDKERVDQKEET